MGFRVGTSVRVVTLRRTGEVVEVGRGGRYRVRVAGVILSCREDDLQEADAGRRRRQADEATPRAAGGDVGADRAPRHEAVPSIDLHGLTVEEALSAVERRLDEALRQGDHALDVIHGRGSGRIKNAVHRCLREIGAVRHFEVSTHNPGVTRVFF